MKILFNSEMISKRKINECFTQVKKPRYNLRENFSKSIKYVKNSRIYSLKFWIIIVCIFGFVYQIWDAVDEYLDYRTVATTQTKYQLESMTTIPAITFCSDVFFDLQRIEADHPGFKKYLRQKFKNNKIIGSNDKRAITFRTIYSFLENRAKDFNWIKAFDYSINFTQFINDCTIFNDSRTESCQSNEASDETSGQHNSIQMFQDYKKCETFRTHLIDGEFMQTISDSITTIGSIDLSLTRHKHTRDKLDIFLDLELTIHSPNEIPHYPDGFINLKRDYLHTLRYWTSGSLLLPSPYDTDCYDYKSDNKLKSKDDCALKCQTIKMKNTCKQCIPDLVIVRKDLLNSSDTVCKTDQLCNSFDKNFKDCTKEFACGLETLQDIYFWCYAQCKTECNKIDYSFTFIEDLLNEDSDDKNTTIITIEPKIVPKVIVKYRPSVSRTNLVANIGGIGSFWLGLTVLEVYKIGEQLISFIITKINR